MAKRTVKNRRRRMRGGAASVFNPWTWGEYFGMTPTVAQQASAPVNEVPKALGIPPGGDVAGQPILEGPGTPTGDPVGDPLAPTGGKRKRRRTRRKH